MNNISFKARIDGLNSEVLKTIFENKTKSDTKHSVVFTPNSESYDEDTFELYKNGKKTAEYKTEVNPKHLSVERLMGIFNILKIKEAQALIEKTRKNNRT